MSRKVIHIVMVAVALGALVVLYVSFQSNPFSVEDILAAYQQDADYGSITIEYPLDETLFPPESVRPVFRWKDSVHASRAWLVRIEFADGKTFIHFPVWRQQWSPSEKDWDSIKRMSLEQQTQVVILGIDTRESLKILSRGRMVFRTSKDRVDEALPVQPL
jgi:hypothetical protein